MRRSKVWIARFFAGSILSLLLIATINFVVDPYGLFRNYDVKGFNQQKEGVRSKIRFVKALELPLRKPETIIIGSSRVHDGMNPESALLRQYPPVYNLGIDMMRIHEMKEYFKHAIVNGDVKRAIIGLDFFMFNSLEKVNASFDHELVGRKIQSEDYLAISLFSREALMDSYSTIKLSRAQPDRKEFLGTGYRPGKYVFYKVKDFEKLHYYTNWVFLTSTPQATKYYASMRLDDDVFADFEEILSVCNQRRIDCRLYISPAHVGLDGEGIRAAGKWEMFENWKRRVAQISFEHGLPLWDFSGYNSVTTEPVTTPMKYYWDSSHFNEMVGNWIVARVMEKPEVAAPTDFGEKIFPANIEDHLAKIRNSRDKYETTNILLNEERDRLYKDILNGASLDLERLKGMYE